MDGALICPVRAAKRDADLSGVFDQLDVRVDRASELGSAVDAGDALVGIELNRREKPCGDTNRQIEQRLSLRRCASGPLEGNAERGRLSSERKRESSKPPCSACAAASAPRS